MTDVTAVALAEEQTAQEETAQDTAVELAEIREEAQTERAEIAADAAVAIAEAQAETGVDEEWLRSQFDAQSQRMAAAEATMLGLTEALTNLTLALAPPLIPTASEEPEPLIVETVEPEADAVEAAPEPAALAKRKIVLF